MSLRRLLLVLGGFLTAALLIPTGAAPVPQKKSTPAKTAPKKKGPSAAATSKGNAARRPAASYPKGRTAGRGPQPVPVRRRVYGQQSPSKDRYTEIQQALIAKGYLTETPTGMWDAAAMDAMKRFQQDQNLPPTGKITSLSLIALGLGPKRNQTSAVPAPTVPTP